MWEGFRRERLCVLGSIEGEMDGALALGQSRPVSLSSDAEDSSLPMYRKIRCTGGVLTR